MRLLRRPAKTTTSIGTRVTEITVAAAGEALFALSYGDRDKSQASGESSGPAIRPASYPIPRLFGATSSIAQEVDSGRRAIRNASGPRPYVTVTVCSRPTTTETVYAGGRPVRGLRPVSS